MNDFGRVVLDNHVVPPDHFLEEGEIRPRPTLRRPPEARTYGEPIAWAFGRWRRNCHLIWATAIKESLPFPSGVGDGSEEAQAEPETSCSFAVGVCQGPIGAITRIWADGVLIFDARPHGLTEEGYAGAQSTPGVVPKLTIYLGSESQGIDPTIQADKGTLTPAFRGLAYIVFEDMALKSFGDRIPDIEAEVLSGAAASFDVATVTTSDLAGDNHAVGFLPFLYALGNGILTRIGRIGLSEASQVDVEALLSAELGTAITVTGKLVVGGFTDTLYIFAKNGSGEGFISKWSGGGTLIATNYASRINFEFQDGVVRGSFLYATASPGLIRKYHKDNLSFQQGWSGAGPKTGNIAFDGDGSLYAISWDDALADEFVVTRISKYGQAKHNTVSGRGRSKSIAHASGALLCGSNNLGYLVKVDPSSLSISSFLENAAEEDQRSTFYSQIFTTTGKFWTYQGTDLKEIDVASLTVTRTIAASSFGSATLSGVAYDASYNALWTAHDASNLKVLFLDRFSVSAVTLSSVISAICQAGGLESSEIETADLAGLTVTGYAIEDRKTAREALEVLRQRYLLDVRERDGKIEWLKRGGVSAATIEEKDLGAGAPEENIQELYEEFREEEEALPRKVTIRHLSAEREYEETSQEWAWREDIVESRLELDIGLPMVLTDDEARQLAQKLIAAAWVERTSYALRLLPKHLRLDPGDIVTLDAEGETRRLRLTSVEIGANLAVHAQAVLDNAAAYTSTASGIATPTEEVLKPLAPTELYLLDIPILQDLDDNPGFYVPVAPAGEGEWDGATVYRAENGLLYHPFVGVLEGSTCGLAETKLADGETAVFDETNTVTIRMLFGTPASATEAQLLADKQRNLALLGDELLQFRDVTDNGDGTYTLGGLLRGRFGTEHETAGHAIGERFILLERSKLARPNPGGADLNVSRKYRGVTVGGLVKAVPAQSFTNTGVGLKPRSPVDFSGQELLRDNSFHFAWRRRTRVGGGWQGGGDIPLGEASEAYEIDLLDGPGGTVKGTITAGPPASLSGVSLQIVGAAQEVRLSSGQFEDHGFVLNQWVTLDGFTNPENNGVWQIVDFPLAGRMKLAHGNTLVDEGPPATGGTITARNPGIRYSEDEQTAHFGGPQSSLTAVVYQLSAVVGRGFGTEGTF